MSWPLGVTTWIWTSPFNTETVALFPKIRKMGFDYVEIPIEDPSIIDVRKVKAAIEANDLKATVCGAFGPNRDLTHEDPAIHRNCLDYIRTCVGMAAAWGATMFAGPAYSAVGKARLVPPDQKKREWDLAVKNLREASKIAADRGIVIPIEPLNRFETDLVNTSEQVVRLGQEIDHPAAKVLLDGFHMNIEEKDVEKAVRHAGKHLAHIQVSDSDRGTPGKAQADWAGLKKGLKAVKYKGPIVIESFTPTVKEIARAAAIWRPLAPSQDSLAKDGLAFLRKWGKN